MVVFSLPSHYYIFVMLNIPNIASLTKITWKYHSYKDVSEHIDDTRNGNLEERKMITTKNRCIDDSYTTDSKTKKISNILNNLTISIADPQGDITLVNTNPNGSFDNQEDAVCTDGL